MSTLAQRALRGTILFLVTLAILIFGPAGSLHFWQGWLYLLVYTVALIIFGVYFLKHDPALIERRLHAGPTAEKTKAQKIIMSFASILYIALLVIAGFDQRFGWSAVNWPLVLLGDLAILIGFWIIFKVFQANSFTAATVRAEKEQKVIDTGPYGIVRHPMYSGSLFLFLGAPLALASWWDFPIALGLTGTVILRLLHEEKYLETGLHGYKEYKQKVRFRLVPGVW